MCTTVCLTDNLASIGHLAIEIRQANILTVEVILLFLDTMLPLISCVTLKNVTFYL